MRNLPIYTTLTLVIFFSFRVGACNTPELQSQLLEAFQVSSRPLDWQSVKRNTLEANKAFPILVQPSYRLSTSIVIYKGARYTLNDVMICPHTSGLSVTKEGLGTVYISRTNSALSNAYVSVQEKNTRIRVILRPARFVN